MTLHRRRLPAIALAGVAAAFTLSACDKAAAPGPAPASAGAVAGDTVAPADGSATLVGEAGAGPAQADAGYGVPTAYSDTPPPPLPAYDQPPIPADGYVWTPGYWDWDENAGDYYWAPGTWVQPPRPGLLWTPGYWRFLGGRYGFAPGHWGARVGFYGGVNYGHGYDGEGYRGGRWQGDHFAYNQTVNNITNVHISAVYNAPAGGRGGGISFNGGAGGVVARPSPAQIAPAREIQLPPTGDQIQHLQAARGDPTLRAGVNHGQPTTLATSRPGALHGPDAVVIGPGAASERPAPARSAEGPRPVYNSNSPGVPPRPEPRPAAPRLSEGVRPPGHPPPTAPAMAGEHPARPPRPEAAPRPAPEPRPAGEPRRAPEGERR